MKINLLFMFCLFTGMGVLAQEVDITGSWTMYEMIWTTGDNVDKTSEDQLKEQGMSSDYDFMPDGKLKMVSNMTGSGKVETIEGTWKLEGDKLTFGLLINETPRDIVWDFEFKDDCIHLKRTSPDGATNVVNSFKRK